MTRSEVKALLRREREKALVSLVYLDLKAPYVAEVAGEAISGGICHSTIAEEIQWSTLFASLTQWELMLIQIYA